LPLVVYCLLLRCRSLVVLLSLGKR
jgi:hypothetical protein